MNDLPLELILIIAGDNFITWSKISQLNTTFNEIATSNESHILKKLTKVVTSDYGQKYTINNKYHRIDGPAAISGDEIKEWYFYGKLHRLNGPAIEFSDGEKHWYLHGKRHRTDGPARENEDGSYEWWLHGQYHRTDGPALHWADGIKAWYLHGKLHRINGPAFKYISYKYNEIYIKKKYYLNGIKQSVNTIHDTDYSDLFIYKD